MKPKLILSLLRVSVTILFYLLILFTLVFLITSLLNIVGGDSRAKKLTSKAYNYEVIGFGTANKESSFVYSSDSLIRYQGQKNHYIVQVEPKSAIGYYGIIMKLIFMGLGIAVLWNFKKIFRQINLDHPFRYTIIRHLKVLAALFIISDIVKFIDYFLFNSFLQQSITSPHFQLITTIGNGIITGMIIWIIAVIYQRGNALQEENALTV